MADNDLDDIEVEDSDTYQFGKDNKFDHIALVMLGIKKCMELGSKDLVEGWWENKTDKHGNELKVYHEDSRKAFINSVKSLLSLVERDYDDDAKKKIPLLINSLVERKKHWLDMEWNWWNTLNNAQKMKLISEGKQVSQGFFNKKLDFDNYYYEEETNIYRQIFTEVNNLTERSNAFKTIQWSN